MDTLRIQNFVRALLTPKMVVHEVLPMWRQWVNDQSFPWQRKNEKALQIAESDLQAWARQHGVIY